jgi:hypothetical protein
MPVTSSVLGAPASIMGSELPSNGLQPFVVDRNIRHFLWYGVVAGDGLRSVGEEALPSSKSVCSILPIAICGPVLSVAPASIMLPLAALALPIVPGAAFALPQSYGASAFPLPCLAGEPVRGRR